MDTFLAFEKSWAQICQTRRPDIITISYFYQLFFHSQYQYLKS